MTINGSWGYRASRCGAVALVILSACSGPSHVPSGPIVKVTLKDFSIHMSTPVVNAGPVTLQIYNEGPATHEFVAVRTELPVDELPIGPDGLSVNEDALTPVGENSEVDLDTTSTLELTLRPDRYVFFCNLEGHYLGGMHAALVAR